MLEQPPLRSEPTLAVPWGPGRVGLALLTLLFFWGLGGVLVLVLSVGLDSSAFRFMAIALVAEGSFLLLAWWFGPRFRSASLSLLGFRRSRGNLVGWAVVALLASLFFNVIYALLVPDQLLPPPLPEEVRAAETLVPAILAIVFLAPLAEEAFFRGFVYPGLARRWGVWGGAAGSSLIFAASHGSVGLLVPAFVSGIVLVWVNRRTGSLWPGILAHAVQNAIAMAVPV